MNTQQGLLAGKAILVVGGASGLGAEIALGCIAAGARSVIVTGRSSRPGNENSSSVFKALDISDLHGAANCVREVFEEHGAIDGMVISAGIAERASLIDTTPEQLQQIFATNTLGPFTLMSEYVRHARVQGGGAIVNIISMSSHGGQPHFPAYSASKAALAALTKNVAHAYRFDRIRANGINLGLTATPAFLDRFRQEGKSEDDLAKLEQSQPMGRLIHPRDVANLVTFLLSDNSFPMTGSIVDFAQRVNGTSE